MGWLNHLGIGGQDAQVGVDLGQGPAQETELAGSHPPGVGEELADQGAVAAWIQAPGNLEDVPAQRARRAGIKLADIHPAIQSGPVQRSPPALAKIQHHAAKMPLAGGLVGQPFGCHALAKAGIAAEGGVKMALEAQAQRGVGQLPGLAAPLPAEDHIAGHVRAEGKVRGRLLHGQGGALLEHAGGGVGCQLQHGQEGRVHVPAEHLGDGLHPGGRGEGLGMQPDVFALRGGQVAGLHAGDHIFRAVKSLRDQSHQSLLALFGARHGVDIGVVSAFLAGQVEQALLLAQDLGHQDGRIELPLVAVMGREGGRNPNRQTGGSCLPNCLPGGGGLHLAVA